MSVKMEVPAGSVPRPKNLNGYFTNFRLTATPPARIVIVYARFAERNLHPFMDDSDSGDGNRPKWIPMEPRHSLRPLEAGGCVFLRVWGHPRQ